MELPNWLAVLITDIVVAVVTWLLARRKYNSEVDNNIIENMKESLEFYKKLSDDTKERLEEVLDENATLRNEVKELRSIVDKLTSSLANYGLTRLLEDADMELIKKSEKKSDGKESKEEKQTGK